LICGKIIINNYIFYFYEKYYTFYKNEYII